jgi:protein-S-isoprenylcysteine O-methyltransferase Ste14
MRHDAEKGTGMHETLVRRRQKKAFGKLRLDRGPLRWWLIVAGIVTVHFDPLRYLIGTVLVLLGAVLHFVSKGYLRQSRDFLRETKSLTNGGPYRFTRNPFYLANLCAEVGLLVIIGRLDIAGAYLVAWAWVYRGTIMEEEAKLAQLVGEEYQRYRSRVPRLVPLPWNFLSHREVSGPPFSWSNPNILRGAELERALRLLSYPLLLHAAALVRAQGAAAFLDPTYTTFLPFIGFLALNVLGRFFTRLLTQPRPNEGLSAPVAQGAHEKQQAA